MFLEPLGKCGARSDYHAWRNKGIPYTFLSSGTPWYYHTPEDTPERLNFEKLSNLVTTIQREFPWQTPTRTPGDWSTLQPVLERIAKTDALCELPALQRLMKKTTAPRRWEIARLQIQILLKLRKMGPSLFSV